jgi:hypothetical protein
MPTLSWPLRRLDNAGDKSMDRSACAARSSAEFAGFIRGDLSYKKRPIKMGITAER